MAKAEEKDVKRISIDLPIELIEGVDRLRKEWGLRRRGLVFERLLEVILSNSLENGQQSRSWHKLKKVKSPQRGPDWDIMQELAICLNVLK